ncbi:hypothetical protein FGIG_06301 [Fasciola gigantica]|uniref:Uncharacterized protein n=1 Tax=Fasciola gigantica TaxID=46835 RepID=A0A504X5Q2_FASGI|nr:hypothetical protein FGIG_06301 [Fasciola gigantica]
MTNSHFVLNYSRKFELITIVCTNWMREIWPLAPTRNICV